MKGRLILALAALAGASAIGLCATQAAAKPAKQTAMAALDGDNSKSVDLAEASKGAEEAFGRLDKDSDGGLTPKELGARLSKKDFEAADGDKDKKLSKEEYMALVEPRLKAADPDSDGSLDEKELKGKDGQALLKLTR